MLDWLYFVGPTLGCFCNAILFSKSYNNNNKRHVGVYDTEQLIHGDRECCCTICLSWCHWLRSCPQERRRPGAGSWLGRRMTHRRVRYRTAAPQWQRMLLQQLPVLVALVTVMYLPDRRIDEMVIWCNRLAWAQSDTLVCTIQNSWPTATEHAAAQLPVLVALVTVMYLSARRRDGDLVRKVGLGTERYVGVYVTVTYRIADGHCTRLPWSSSSYIHPVKHYPHPSERQPFMQKHNASQKRHTFDRYYRNLEEIWVIWAKVL